MTREGKTRPEAAAGLPVGLTRHVSGLLPRVGLVAAAATGVAAQTLGLDVPVGPLLPVVLALLAAWRPALPTVGPAVLGLMVLAVVGGGGPDLRDAVTVLAVHVLHVSAGLSAAVPVAARLELAALRPTWQRFLLVQVVSQAAVVLAMAVSLAR
ncbi:hypothetical protein [Aquipuribacter sp. MA13-6]|uniref:hypothetical protein n=1 Tax=unclassified Aquipuribacter TaxID=2635084 RepID=UPI003EEE5F66